MPEGESEGFRDAAEADGEWGGPVALGESPEQGEGVEEIEMADVEGQGTAAEGDQELGGAAVVGGGEEEEGGAEGHQDEMQG